MDLRNQSQDENLGTQANLEWLTMASHTQVVLCAPPGGATHTDSMHSVMPGSLDLLCSSLPLKKHKNQGMKNNFFGFTTTWIFKISCIKGGAWGGGGRKQPAPRCHVYWHRSRGRSCQQGSWLNSKTYWSSYQLCHLHAYSVFNWLRFTKMITLTTCFH